ncbi:MAG: hypothetical protein AB7O65_05960 [Candidatus Korobacteraceae bacterium]
MKRFMLSILAVLVAGALGMVQAQQPAAAAAAPQGRPQPKVASQAEYTAFQEASAKQSPGELELAAMEFEMKFPKSEVRSLLFLNAMRVYQGAGNSEKTIELGRKVLTIYPDEPDALLAIANELASRTRDSDLDRDERLSEAMSLSQKALDSVDQHIMLPPNATPEQADGIKNLMRSMAHAAMGTVQLTKKDYPAAEKHFDTATKVNTAYPDPVVWLRLAVSREQQKKYKEALEAASQAVTIAPAGSQAANLARAQRDRLQKLVEGGAPAGGATAAPSPAPTSPAPAPSSPTPQ